MVSEPRSAAESSNPDGATSPGPDISKGAGTCTSSAHAGSPMPPLAAPLHLGDHRTASRTGESSERQRLCSESRPFAPVLLLPNQVTRSRDSLGGFSTQVSSRFQAAAHHQHSIRFDPIVCGAYGECAHMGYASGNEPFWGCRWTCLGSGGETDATVGGEESSHRCSGAANRWLVSVIRREIHRGCGCAAP